MSVLTRSAGVDVFTPTQPTRRQSRPGRWLLTAFLMVIAIGWLLPLLLAFYASLRPYQETARLGYFSWPEALNFHYYAEAWRKGSMGKFYVNTLIVAIPSVIATLFFASFVGFLISLRRIPGKKFLLIMFTAGNLLPQQIILTPLFVMFRKIPLPWWMNWDETLYNSYWGVALVHVAFQTGFCVFVLANYMDTVPRELIEASIVDGVGVFRQYWQVIMPLVRPALGALGTLQFAWIYNDFLWALILMSSPEKLPITSALNNLRAVFFTDYNLIAAGSLLVALPPMIVFFVLQRQFISGLTLGANKG